MQFSRSYPSSGGQPVLFHFMGAGDVLDRIEFRFQFHKRRQLFIGVNNKAFGVLTLCDRNPKIVGLRDPYLRWQPQLQPALLRLSAMISHTSRGGILPFLCFAAQ